MMDEMAEAVKVDPVQFRLMHITRPKPGDTRYPYDSFPSVEVLQEVAKAFGWEKRNPQPRSMREGKQLVGWGMATGIWDAMQQKASARAVLTANGSVEIASATADMGPGTYTMMVYNGNQVTRATFVKRDGAWHPSRQLGTDAAKPAAPAALPLVVPQSRFQAPAAGQRAGMPRDSVTFQQMVRQNKERVRQQMLQMQQQTRQRITR